jgi:hypothetical protein
MSLAWVISAMVAAINIQWENMNPENRVRNWKSTVGIIF